MAQIIGKTKYNIEYQGFFKKKKISFNAHYHDFEPVDTKGGFKDGVLQKMRNYKIEATDLAMMSFWNLRAENSHVNMISYIIKCEDSDVHVCEIGDIYINPKLRNRNIGKNLLIILEDICTNNNVEYIVGELDKDEYLDKRMKFFESCDFDMWHSDQAKFSQWVIVKKLLSSDIINS